MSIDLTWEALPEGEYDAVIRNVEFKFGASLSIVIVWRALHEGQEYFVDEWLTLDAPKTSPNYQRSAEGKGRIMQILSAYGEEMPSKIEPNELVETLEGKALRIVISHRRINGLPAPKVAKVKGKA
jgi:hypothetical protein